MPRSLPGRAFWWMEDIQHSNLAKATGSIVRQPGQANPGCLFSDWCGRSSAKGNCCCLDRFVQSAGYLYVLRFLPGVAEANNIYLSNASCHTNHDNGGDRMEKLIEEYSQDYALLREAVKGLSEEELLELRVQHVRAHLAQIERVRQAYRRIGYNTIG